MPFLNTNTNAYRDRVREYLLSSLVDDVPSDFNPHDTGLIADAAKWDKTVAHDARRAAYIAGKFDSEYNYPDNRTREPNIQDRVAGWLAGLPLNIAYEYATIAEDAAKLHHPNVLTDAEIDKVQDQWFRHMAFHLCRIWRQYGLSVPV